jgi:hypothetical protein
MSHAECPNCRSESVSWRGSYHICKGCGKWHHHRPCFFCGHPEIWASCGDCEWMSDPYGLLDVEDEEDEENSE